VELFSSEEYGLRLIRDLIQEKVGFYLDDSSLVRIKNRLNQRLEEHNLDSFEEYWRYLKYSSNGEDEFQQVLERLVNRETYFFREVSQLRVFQEHILLKIWGRKAKTSSPLVLRFLSAGCASGEEPYTLAMLVRESGLFSLGWRVEIVGVDISQVALGQARAGVYDSRSLRSQDGDFAGLVKKYFYKENGGYRLCEEVRRMVTFGEVNLLDSLSLQRMAPFDVIFCRNVMIYFQTIDRVRLVQNLYDALDDNGYLFLGHSESLYKISADFEMLSFDGAVVYQKKGLGNGK
jgi:chemotaxis protein methyltransferase CheR